MFKSKYYRKCVHHALLYPKKILLSLYKTIFITWVIALYPTAHVTTASVQKLTRAR